VDSQPSLIATSAITLFSKAPNSDVIEPARRTIGGGQRIGEAANSGLSRVETV